MSDQPELAPPQFAPQQKVCGNCKLWRIHSIDAARGWVGECRVQTNRGLFTGAAPVCDAFAPRGEAAKALAEEAATVRRAKAIQNIGPVVRSASGTRTLSASTLVPTIDRNTPVDLEGATMTRQELMDLFLEASGLADVPLAQKWEGGSIKLVPANPEIQPKDIPLDSLFHKVVMIRDRLRTLEQKLFFHPEPTDTEKVEMQQYVTRCYGSLTTFNVLFRDKGDQFIGQKGDE